MENPTPVRKLRQRLKNAPGNGVASGGGEGPRVIKCSGNTGQKWCGTYSEDKIPQRWLRKGKGEVFRLETFLISTSFVFGGESADFCWSGRPKTTLGTLRAKRVNAHSM